MSDYRAAETAKPTRENTIPFMIIGDRRTVDLANAVIQKVSESVFGIDNGTVVKSHLYGSLVLWITESEERIDELMHFYRSEWEGLPLQKREYAMPVRWLISANDALTELAERFPYGRLLRPNKSLAFCVLMAYAAKYRYGIGVS